MTTGPAALRLEDNFLLGTSAGVAAAVAAGSVCNWSGLADPATTSVTALALGAPPAVELQIRSRRRDTNVDIARIQRGELGRPVGLGRNTQHVLTVVDELTSRGIGFRSLTKGPHTEGPMGKATWAPGHD